MSAATIGRDETLELRLKALRLPSFLEQYIELAERAAAEGWSHVRYLAELVTQEAEDRADRRITRLLHGCEVAARQDGGDPGPEPLRRAAARADPRAAARRVPRRRNQRLSDRPARDRQIARHGGAGPSVGRSRTPGSVHPVVQLVERLLDAKKNLRLARELKRLDNFECIALDDIGYVQHDRAEMEVLFALLAERYERKSVMITSNLVFSKWDQIFKDPMTTAAAIDRVVHHAVVLEFLGPSVRAEVAEERARAASTKRNPAPQADA